MVQLCKGGCGKLAVYGKWCCESYYTCEGYRKKLSTRAKIRGNNGVQGSKSKLDIDFSAVPDINLICSRCSSSFKNEAKNGTIRRSQFIPICPSCKSSQLSESARLAHKVRSDKLPYEERSWRYRRKLIWEEQGQKCNVCGFDSYDLESGPYELHHIDGNANNKTRSNEEILCCNCHAMTDTYRFKNGDRKTPTKAEIFGGIYKKRYPK